MKFLKLFSNKGLNLLVTSLFIFGSSIQNVKADECVDLENAIKLLGDNIIKVFSDQKVQNCCDYNQITCESIQGGLHITGIKLDNVDTFHKGSETEAVGVLSNLPYLYTFEITSSGFSKMPGNIDKLKNLKTLILSGNNYHETLPIEIGRLSNLEVLNFTRGLMTGTIPVEYCNLVKLKTLDLSEQKFTGAIPYCFKKLKNLEILKLKKNNGFEGYVPILPKIKSCDYQNTKLCTFKSAKCKSNSKPCTAEDVKSTNLNNGNPNPNSNEYEDEVSPDPSSPSNKNNNSFIDAFLSIMKFLLYSVVLIIIAVFSIRLYKKRNKNNGSYKKLINNSNSINTTYSGNYNISSNASSRELTNIPDFTILNDKSNPYLNDTELKSSSSTSKKGAIVTTPNNSSMAMTAYPLMTVAYVPPTMPGVAYDPQMPGTAYITQPVYMPYPQNASQPGLIYPLQQPPVQLSVTQPNVDPTNERPPSYSAIFEENLNLKEKQNK